MDKLSYHRHRYPSIVIQQAIWLYFRFALSYRDVEDMLAERGIDVSYETVRRWALKFGAIIARKLRRARPRPDMQWHLDEVFIASALSGRRSSRASTTASRSVISSVAFITLIASLVLSRRQHIHFVLKSPPRAYSSIVALPNWRSIAMRACAESL